MTHRILPPTQKRATALALVIASSSATVQADPAAAQNIPDRAANLAPRERPPPMAEPSQLPLPYQAWQGTGFAPPELRPSRDLPPPLARARERPRRPFELSVALSTFLPTCGSGTVDDRRCLTVSAGTGVDAGVLFRVVPFFAIGAEAALSGFGGRGHGLLSQASGDARFFGLVGRVYFADDGVWDPYLALTLGTGALRLRSEEASPATESTTGFGGRVAGGLDYVLGSHFRLGAAASLARWVAWSDEAAFYGRLLGFATLGFRLTASFGDVL